METARRDYVNGIINEYELADILGLDYSEIGAYIMNNGLRAKEEGALYKIVCPGCGQKWLIPPLDTYTCEKCQRIIKIDWGL